MVLNKSLLSVALQYAMAHELSEKVKEMKPKEVHDQELAQGIDDITPYLPPQIIPVAPEFMPVVDAIFYDRLPETATFMPRVELDQDMAMRHLLAIRAAKHLSPEDKRANINRLINLWYMDVSFAGVK